ncbi:MAG: MFS transporter [Candidatus Zixiibacteriota bacterium]
MNSKFFAGLGGNRQVVALSVARMSEAIGNSILFIVIPIYVAKLPSLTLHFAVPVLVGILISSYGFVNSSLQPVMGALSDKLGRRKILIQTGMLIMGLGTLGFVLADRYLHLLALRSLQGVGIAITIPASMALMAAVTNKETRGGSMGIYSMLRMVGFSAGPVIGGFIQVHFGFNAVFITGSMFIFLATILVQMWVKDVPVTNNNNKFRIIDRSLLSPAIIAAGLATFVMAFSFSMVTTLENEFNAKLGINAFGFSIAISSMMVGRILLQVPLGRLSDRIGRRPLIIGGLILLAPASALIGDTTTLTQLVVLRIIQGVASAGIAAPAFALVGDLGKAGGEGRQMSVITMGFGLGMAIGPLVAGFLAIIFFQLPFYAGGLLCLIMAFVAFKNIPETVESKIPPSAG